MREIRVKELMVQGDCYGNVGNDVKLVGESLRKSTLEAQLPDLDVSAEYLQRQ